MRVLVTGMGGEIGTRVAQILEERSEVTEILGVDFVPPRRRLQRSDFKRIDPRDRDKLVRAVLDFDPQAIAHAGVYEPGARMSGDLAKARSDAGVIAAIGAAARTGSLQRVALRSALEVYGRGPNRPRVPDEESLVAPTTLFGRIVVGVEATAADLGRRHGFTVAALRYAPVIGPHLPSPLGRVLRLPSVPVPAFSDPAISLISLSDSARIMVDALLASVDGPVNVVAPGSITPWQAARLGGRLPVPIAWAGWTFARRASDILGAPVPSHVMETLRHGRTADSTRLSAELGFRIEQRTRDICAELFDWAPVVPLRPGKAA